MHYIPLIDAGISASEEKGTYVPYDEGVRQGVFVYDTNGSVPFKGKVWNLVSTTWPDFTNPKTMTYYTEMMSSMHKDFEYDGAWIVSFDSIFIFEKRKNCKLPNVDLQFFRI